MTKTKDVVHLPAHIFYTIPFVDYCGAPDQRTAGAEDRQIRSEWRQMGRDAAAHQ
jgi:hypothetical protein